MNFRPLFFLFFVVGVLAVLRLLVVSFRFSLFSVLFGLSAVFFGFRAGDLKIVAASGLHREFVRT